VAATPGANTDRHGATLLHLLRLLLLRLLLLLLLLLVVVVGQGSGQQTYCYTSHLTSCCCSYTSTCPSAATPGCW
jgi:hypothetical protein